MSSPQWESQNAGDRLIAGRYRLRRRLGQGSMGIVWEAFDEFLRRPVAVKEVLLPPGIPDEEAEELRERTLREARAIAALSHPNVVTLHDVVRADGEPFVVTEYLAARSLAGVISSFGPLDATSAAVIADAVAAGLAAAHQSGITHRDVKPGNVLVAADGQVKLTDFGIARNVSENTITRTGIMLGSPAYMAPEIASGGAVTPAVDLWGLGATLFAATEGHPPYVSASGNDTGDDAGGAGAAVEVISRVVHGEVPRPASTGPLSEIISALMVKDPDARISLAQVRDRLYPLLPGPSTPLLTAMRERDADQADQTPTAVTAPPREQQRDEPEPAAAPTEQPGEAPVLAETPGPLPFHRPPRPARPTARRRRGGLATTLLVLLAVVLFVVSAGGGFALTRVVGDVGLLPPQRQERTTSPGAAGELSRIMPRSGNTSTVAGAQGGGFTVPVPVDWVTFVEERTSDQLPYSTKVSYVSPNGSGVLTVERFPGFYPDHSIERYLAELRDHLIGSYRQVERQDIAALVDNPPETGQYLVYHSTDGAPDPQATRSGLRQVTFANLLPTVNDLWVVGVTVPVQQQDTGKSELFDATVPEFTLSR